MTFLLSDIQLEQLVEWKATLPKLPSSAIEGAFTYSFTPTAIGIDVTVRYWNGEEINISNYEDW
jgi:hypothetical protein